MRIVLDTNILRQDFQLKSKKIELLMNFINKTEHSIVLPQVIFDEIAALYGRKIVETVSKINDSRKKLDRLMFSHLEMDDCVINIEKEVNLFQQNIKKRFQFHKDSIIPLNNSHLPELVLRSINRKPPLSRPGEFRDGIIWLSFFDIASKFKNEPITFISGNISDFCDPEKKLHPDLVKEANEKNLQLHFYTSLDDFLRQHAAKIDFITEKWILSSIGEKTLIEFLDDYLKDHIYDLKEKILSEDRNIKDVTDINALSLNLHSFYVYEYVDLTYNVQAYIECEIEVEFMTTSKTNFYYDYLHDDYFEDDYECMESRTSYAEIEFNIEIEGDKILEYEITGCHFNWRSH